MRDYDVINSVSCDFMETGKAGLCTERGKDIIHPCLDLFFFLLFLLPFGISSKASMHHSSHLKMGLLQAKKKHPPAPGEIVTIPQTMQPA